MSHWTWVSGRLGLTYQRVTCGLNDLANLRHTPVPDVRLCFVPQIWSVATQKFAFTLTGHQNWVRCVHISPDGRLAVSGGDDRTVRIWDLNSKKVGSVELGSPLQSYYCQVGWGSLSSCCILPTFVNPIGWWFHRWCARLRTRRG